MLCCFNCKSTVSDDGNAAKLQVQGMLVGTDLHMCRSILYAQHVFPTLSLPHAAYI